MLTIIVCSQRLHQSLFLLIIPAAAMLTDAQQRRKRVNRPAQREQQPSRPDPRVASALKEKNINYTIDINNNYEVVIKLAGGRHQDVTIFSDIIRVKYLSPARIVASVALRVKGKLPQWVKDRVERENDSESGVRWDILEYGDSWAITCDALPDYDIGADELLEVITKVAQEADRLEKDLSGPGDVF